MADVIDDRVTIDQILEMIRFLSRDPLSVADVAVNVGPPAAETKEQACENSGGTVTTRLCCKSVEDFPALCNIGACGCLAGNSHTVTVCNCGEGSCFDGDKCIVEVRSFDDCVAAGYPVLEGQCRTPDGQTFVEGQ